MPLNQLFIPAIQYGFAGFCLVLTAILVWLVDKLLTIYGEVGPAMRQIANNTDKTRRSVEKIEDHLGEIDLQLRTMERKC